MRAAAVSAYSQGHSLARIEADTGVHRVTLLRLIARALRPHPDARLWGYRALVPFAHVQPYERAAAPKVLVHGKAGNAGAFAQLLLRHPGLAKQLRSEVTSGKVRLEPGSPRGRLSGLKAAIGRFHQTCRELGLGAGDYPLNQQDRAVRSLARTLRAWIDDNYALAAHASGTRIKPASALRQSTRAVLDAFDTVEFDAHKLDLRLKVILERDPLGGEHSVEIERVWLLAVIDVATRCVLGWSLGLGRECNRFDAIETMKRAVVPAARPELSLPGLRLIASGGFVSQALPQTQTQFACWRQIRLDNARAHLAVTAQSARKTLATVAKGNKIWALSRRPSTAIAKPAWCRALFPNCARQLCCGIRLFGAASARPSRPGRQQTGPRCRARAPGWPGGCAGTRWGLKRPADARRCRGSCCR